MAMVINTNVASLTAQRNLGNSQNALSASLQRLSSGMRINSAKDDAAGLAISQRFTAQVNGMNQAARNANDAVSLAQTAEGALDQVSANLQRIRELAVQSANASNSTSDRAALNAEATKLISEIDRVAQSTQFNGVNLLDGTFTSKSFQIGANNSANDRLSITSIASARSSALGVGANAAYSATQTTAAVDGVGLAAAGALTLNGYNVGASATDGVSNISATGSALAIANAINAVSGDSGVTAAANANTKSITVVASCAAAGTASTIKINGVSIGDVALVISGAASAAAQYANNFVAAINSVSTSTGVTAAVTTAGSGEVTLTAADGRNIQISATTGADLTALGDATFASVTTGTVTLTSTSSSGLTIASTVAGATAAGVTNGYTAATTTTSSGVSSLNLATAAGAQAALTIIDSALTNVNNSRASLGAYQNVFNSAISTLQTGSENLAAARSRIVDADFASETATMTRANILQQAGTAMLAQANQLPNLALQLLR